MPEDPEVNLIFNAESEEAQKKLQELVAKFEGISESITRAGEKLKSFEADARDLADNAGRLDELAAKSGNAKAIKDVNAVFSAGVAAVAGYGEEVTKCTNSLMSFGAEASKVLSDFKNGSISFKEAEAALERYTAFAAKSEGVVDSLSKKVAKGFRELGRAAELDDALSAWGRLSETTGQARKQLAEADEAVQGQLAALAALREGLDATSESYASQELAITRQENVLKKQAEGIKGLREELLGMAMAVREAFSEKNTGKGFGDALSKLTGMEKEVEAAVESTSKALSTQEVETARFAVVSQRATNAIEKEARKEEENAYAMRLAAMGKEKLAVETRKLIEARKKAAAVGDVAGYQRLTAQLGQCRTAMRGLVQQQQVNKIAMLQQAQTVAQMGGQLESVVGGIANFGEAAKEGSVNVTGLASSVMSLSMAIKAGLGPLGWVLMAVQGLQMAWNAYARDAKAAEERTLKLAEANDKLRDALQGVGRAEAQRRAEEMKGRWEQEDAVREYAREIDEANAKEDDRRAREDIERAAEKAQSEIAIERGALETKKKLGQVSEAEYEAKQLELARRERDIEQKKQDDLQQIDVDAAKRRVEAASEAYQTAEGRVQEVKDELGEDYEYLGDESVEKLISLIKGIENEQNEIQAQIDNTKEVGKANKSTLKAASEKIGEVTNFVAPGSALGIIGEGAKKIGEEEEDIKDKLKNLNGKLEGAGLRLKAAYNKLAEVTDRKVDEVAKFVGSYDTNSALKKEAESALRTAEVNENNAQNALNQAQDAQTHGRKQRAAQEETTRSLEDLAAAAKAEARARKERLERVQREGSLADQMEVLQELRQQVVRGCDEWKEYTNKIRSLRERMRDEEWQDVQRKGLDEQEKWLKEMLTHFKAGSERAKKWERALRQVKDKALAEELKDLEKTFKVTGKYAEEDARTQAEIHKADLESLQARRAALEKMKAAPDVDAATLKAVNEKIKDTDKETKALRQGMKKAAAEAQKAVTNLKPLGKKAKAPNLQAPLKRAEKAYVELAKKAERQAANGDEKGLARTQERMRRLAVDMERWMGYTGEAAKLQKETNDKLQKIRQGTAEVDRGLTYEQKQENQVRRALGEKVRYHARGAQAAQRAAESAGDEAKANAQAAKNARKNAQASRPTGQVNKAAAVNADVSGLRAQVQRLEAAQGELVGNMGALSGAMGNLAAAAERAAGLAGSMGSAAASALGRLEKKIASIEKQIDRINRKIS